MKKLLTVVLTFAGISSAHAEWVNISCLSSQNVQDARELIDDSSNIRQTISGQWGRAYMSNGNSFIYFSVDEEGYQSVNESCQSNFSAEYIAQASYTYQLDEVERYYLFLINRANGEKIFAPGVVQEYFNSDFELNSVLHLLRGF